MLARVLLLFMRSLLVYYCIIIPFKPPLPSNKKGKRKKDDYLINKQSKKERILVGKKIEPTSTTNLIKSKCFGYNTLATQ